jgi:phosphohistidine phosphatase
MKTLFIIRHAKAVDRSLGIPDFERVLIKAGIKETKKIAKKFKELGIQPDLFISSPANRAFETAKIFGTELGYSNKKIIIEDELYHSSSGISFVDILKELNDEFNIVCLFGHEPTLSDLANFLFNDFQGDVPKSGIVGIDFDVKNWKNI